MTTPAFKQQQYAFTAHIRDPENHALPDGIEDRRMKIYRELLFNNVNGFVSSAFPVLRSLYEDETWQRMIRDFFAHHQSVSPYFLKISEEFLAYLQQEHQPQPEDPAGMIELAHYEWVELALSVLDEDIEMDDIDPNGDLVQGRPVISPLAWPLAYQFPVHQMGPDFLPETAPEQPTYLVVYRNRNDEIRFMELNPVTARLLHLLQEDSEMTGKRAIATIVDEMQHPQPEIVMHGGRAALLELQETGIIIGTAR